MGRIVFYDVDFRPMDKRLTDEERPLYLKKIKKDITHFKKSYTRADLQVSKVINTGSDRTQLSSMAKQAQEAMGAKDLSAVADR